MVNTQRRLKEALEELGEQVIQHFRDVMDSDLGINNKTGTNTLHDSNIYKNMEMQVYPDSEMVQILINSYADYIDMGRMSRGEVETGNFTPMKGGGFPPIEVIRDWAQRKGIPTDNRTLYLIGRSIAIKGIRPRPVFSYAWRDLDDMLPDYLNNIFEAIISSLEEWFNK